MKKKQNIVSFVAIAVLICALIFLGVTVITRIFSLTDLHAELTGTLLGTIITAIVTVLLLKGQTEIEENKDIGIHIFEKKQDVYFDFINTLENITQDQRINIPNLPGYIEPQNSDEINDELQHLLYQLGKVQMTATKETSETVTKLVGQVLGIMNGKNPKIADKYSKFAGVIFQIVSVLRKDLYSTKLNSNEDDFTAIDSNLIFETLQNAGLNLQQVETDEEILANYCDLMIAEFKETYHTTGTHVEFNGKEVSSIEAAKEFLKSGWLQIRTPVGNTKFDFELVNDSKYRNIQNQIGLRNDWPKVHNIRPINFVNKDSAFYNFKSADGNGRKQIVKETLAACKGLEELLKC